MPSVATKNQTFYFPNSAQLNLSSRAIEFRVSFTRIPCNLRRKFHPSLNRKEDCFVKLNPEQKVSGCSLNNDRTYASTDDSLSNETKMKEIGAGTAS